MEDIQTEKQHKSIIGRKTQRPNELIPIDRPKKRQFSNINKEAEKIQKQITIVEDRLRNTIPIPLPSNLEKKYFDRNVLSIRNANEIVQKNITETPILLEELRKLQDQLKESSYKFETIQFARNKTPAQKKDIANFKKKLMRSPPSELVIEGLRDDLSSARSHLNQATTILHLAEMARDGNLNAIEEQLSSMDMDEMNFLLGNMSPSKNSRKSNSAYDQLSVDSTYGKYLLEHSDEKPDTKKYKP